jgi:hypothetical protein
MQRIWPPEAWRPLSRSIFGLGASDRRRLWKRAAAYSLACHGLAAKAKANRLH